MTSSETSPRTPHRLRLLTYLSPSLPVALYQLYQAYLEEALGVVSYLAVESRWSGPPEGQVDPFTADDMDIGFMCSPSLLRLTAEASAQVELLEAAPIHVHPESALRPVYYSELIASADKDESKYKTFEDLRGHSWAYNDCVSLSGNLCVHLELKRLGEDETFFSRSVHSGSHLKSIELVLANKVDTAAIDSNTLIAYFLSHPEHKKKLRVIASLGPHPIQPVVVNKRLPGEIKKRITKALLEMNVIPKWKERLAEFGVWGFKPVNMSFYDQETQLKDLVQTTRNQNHVTNQQHRNTDVH